jgi:hypothetical protein
MHDGVVEVETDASAIIGGGCGGGLASSGGMGVAPPFDELLPPPLRSAPPAPVDPVVVEPPDVEPPDVVAAPMGSFGVP